MKEKLIAAIFLILMIYGCGGSYNGLTLNKKIPENHIDDTKKPSNPGVPLNEEEVNISLFNEYFGEWECVDDCDSPCPFDLSLEFVKDGDKILVYTAGSKDSAKLELNKDGSLYRSLTSMAYGYPNSLGCLMTIEDSSLIYECIYYAEGSEENNIDEYYQVCQSAIFEKKS